MTKLGIGFEGLETSTAVHAAIRLTVTRSRSTDGIWPTNLPEAKKLAEALKSAAEHPELVLLKIMSRVDGVDSISIKDERRTRH
jgi:hypothetical protein